MLIYVWITILRALKACPLKSVTSLSAKYMPTTGQILLYPSKCFPPGKNPTLLPSGVVGDSSTSLLQSWTEIFSSKPVCPFSPTLSTSCPGGQRWLNWWCQKQYNYLTACILLIITQSMQQNLLLVHWNWRWCMGSYPLGWKYYINSMWWKRPVMGHNLKSQMEKHV